MNKDRIEGSAKQVKGAVEEGAGKLVGNERLQAQGEADKAEGKIQSGVGHAKESATNAKDAVKDAVNK